MVGILAGVVAIVTVVVFGYLSLTTPLIPGPRGPASRPRSGPLTLVKREHIVDKDYLFELTGPDARWRVFDHAAADKGWADVNAAMLNPEGIVQLHVNRVGDITLDQAAILVSSWRSKKAATSDAITWLGRDAVELRFDYTDSSVFERLFLRDGYIYSYTLIPFIGSSTPDEAERTVQWNALTLIDGHVVPSVFDPSPRDSRGPTWRIENGRWESAIAELAVQPPRGWRLIVGRELRRRHLTSDLMLTNDGIGCSIEVALDTTFERDPSWKTALHTTVAGQEHDLYEVPSNGSSRQWKMQIDGGGIDVEVDVWAPAADGDVRLDEVKQGLAAIARITAAERATVEADLIAAPYHSTFMGKNWVDRNGTYVDYVTGLMWAHPPEGLWTITTGPGAEDIVVGAAVAASDVRAGLSFSLAADPAIATTQPPAKWLKANGAVNIKPIDLSGIHANLRTAAEGRWKGGAASWTHQVGAFVDDAGAAVRVNIWGQRAALTAGQVELAKAIGGTVVVNAVPTHDDRGWYEDRRLGYAVALPGWTHDRKESGDTSTDQTWSRGAAMIGVLAELRGGIDDPVTIARARNLASEGVAAGYDYPVHRMDTTIGGEPATRLTWDEGGEEVAVFLVEHHEIDYTLYSRGPGALGEIVHGFHFLENPVNGD